MLRRFIVAFAALVVLLVVAAEAAPADQPPGDGTDRQQPGDPLQLLIPQLLPNSQ